MRARIQCGGVGPHPGIDRDQTGSGASGLVAPDLPGLGMAQRAGSTQGDELPSGPAPDGEKWAHWLAAALEKAGPSTAPVASQCGFRSARAGASLGSGPGAVGLSESGNGLALLLME